MRSGAHRAGRLSALTLLITCGIIGAARAQDDLPFSSSGYGAAPLGIVDSYMWARHSVGDGMGYRASYSNLGAFVPLVSNYDSTSMFFFEPRVLVTNHGQFGANAGVGYRGFMPDVNKVLGLSLWYDRDNGHFFQYDQMGATAELLGDNWDLRTNCYFPLGERNRLISEFSNVGVNPTFVGRNILLGAIDSQREVALGGLDAEIGRNISAVPGLRMYGGYYYYQGDYVGAAHGARFRLSYQMSDMVGAGFTLTDDRVFGTNAVFNVTLQWPQRNAPIAGAYYVEDRMNIQTERHDRVVATIDRQRDQVFAQNRDSNQRIDVVHVDDNAAAGGDGSINSPVNTLTAAQNAAQNGSIIFVRSGTYTDSIALSNGQRLLGDGLGTHIVSARQGSFLLPGQTVGGAPVISPTNSSYAVLLGPGSFGTEVAGFSIVNGSAFPVAGIAGISNSSFYIHDNSVTVPDGYGIALMNASTGGTWQNGTALNHSVGIFDNNVSGSGFGGIVVAHATLTSSDFQTLGIDPDIADQLPTSPSGGLTLSIQGNQVASNGTSAATSPLDSMLGQQVRYGIGVASTSTTQTQIDVTIDDNQVTGNGISGSTNESNGGIAVNADNAGRLTGTISNNTVNNNAGVGVAMVAQGNGVIQNLTVTGNPQIQNNSLAGIAAASDDNGQITNLVISQNADISANGSPGILESGGVLLTVAGAGVIDGASISANSVNNNGSLGVGLQAGDNGQIRNASVSSNLQITGNNLAGIAAAADGNGQIDNLVISQNADISGNGSISDPESGGVLLRVTGSGQIDSTTITSNSITNNGSLGIGLQSDGSGRIQNTLISSNLAINANQVAGIAADARSSSQITNLVISDNFEINSNGVFSSNAANAAEATGGIILTARDGGLVNGEIDNNTLEGNYGVGILATTLDRNANLTDDSEIVLQINNNSISDVQLGIFDNPEGSGTFEIISGVFLRTEEGELTISQMQNNVFAGDLTEDSSNFDTGLLVRFNVGTINLNSQNNTLYAWRFGISGSTNDTAIFNATINNNLFGPAAGQLANESRDFSFSSNDQSTVNLNFNNNQGTEGYSFIRNGTSTFNVISSSGNNPAPTGP